MSDRATSDLNAFPQRRRLAQGDAMRHATLTAPLLLAVFMATMILPVSIEVAGIRLTPLRMLLLACFVPLCIKLMSGQPLRIIATDIFLSLFCIWMVMSFMVVEGSHRFAFSMMSSIEILGGYLLGRFVIRNIVDFRYLVRLHLVVLAILFPFALIEFLTGRQIWSSMLDIVGDAPWRLPSSRPRMGFDRVLAGFDHPILFGVFCSMIFALLIYGWKIRTGRTVAGLGFVTFMTFMSLSSGAVLSVLLQSILVAWDWVTKGRWKLLIGLGAAMFVFLELASNRGPIIIFIETMTFDSGTAWTRILQWQYAGAEVLRNPFFGKGIDGDWIRPSWLTGSIDSYWLVVAYRHGFPAIIALGAAIAFTVIRILRAHDLPPEVARLRTGYVIALTGICFSMATVHLWDATAVYFFFFLGAGLWIAEAAGTAGTEETAADDMPERQAVRYSRFAPDPVKTARNTSPPDERRRPVRAG
jgi:hypothetical protein